MEHLALKSTSFSHPLRENTQVFFLLLHSHFIFLLLQRVLIFVIFPFRKESFYSEQTAQHVTLRILCTDSLRQEICFRTDFWKMGQIFMHFLLRISLRRRSGQLSSSFVPVKL